MLHVSSVHFLGQLKPQATQYGEKRCLSDFTLEYCWAAEAGTAEDEVEEAVDTTFRARSGTGFMSSRLETQGAVEGLGRLEGVSEEEEEEVEAEEGSPPPAVEVFTSEGAALEEEGVEG